MKYFGVMISGKPYLRTRQGNLISLQLFTSQEGEPNGLVRAHERNR